MDIGINISKELAKEEKYKSLVPQLKALFEGEDDFIANMANLAAVLHESFEFLWTGFYLWKEDVLVLGPFQGPIACTRIRSGSGVCGTAFSQKQTIMVEDVDQFPGHIACSPDSRSEIVVPMISSGRTIGVFDIDSRDLSNFDQVDKDQNIFVAQSAENEGQ